MPNFINSIRWINMGLIVLTLLSYLSPFTNPNHFWPISLLGLIYPILLVFHLFFIIYWIFKKDRYFLFSLTCMILGWSFLSKNIGFNSQESGAVNTVKIMTFNTSAGRNFLNPKTKREDESIFSQYVGVQNAEIICFQEYFNSPSLQQIQHADQKKYQIAHAPSGRIAIASVYPIIHSGSFGFLNPTNGTLFADLDIHGQTIRVYSIHLQSNQITNIANQVAQKKDFRERETWKKIKQMFKGYRESAKIRADQAQEIADHIAESPYPIILCGDFNDVPQSYAYQTLAKGMNDHFQDIGKGMGSTFVGSIPFLRIDYILSSPSLKSVKTQIIKDRYSDHYPVVSYVEIGK